MATITGTKVSVSDDGQGVNPEVIATVTLGSGQTVMVKMTGQVECNLTNAQMNALQNAATVVKNRAEIAVKANFLIP